MSGAFATILAFTVDQEVIGSFRYIFVNFY